MKIPALLRRVASQRAAVLWVLLAVTGVTVVAACSTTRDAVGRAASTPYPTYTPDVPVPTRTFTVTLTASHTRTISPTPTPGGIYTVALDCWNFYPACGTMCFASPGYSGDASAGFYNPCSFLDPCGAVPVRLAIAAFGAQCAGGAITAQIAGLGLGTSTVPPYGCLCTSCDAWAWDTGYLGSIPGWVPSGSIPFTITSVTVGGNSIYVNYVAVTIYCP